MFDRSRVAQAILRIAKAVAAAPKEWLGDTKCDLCRKPITGYLYDAVADSGRGSWATMCKKCWRQEGAHLGLGKGQEYVETAPGKFELNRGGSGGDRRLKPCRK